MPLFITLNPAKEIKYKIRLQDRGLNPIPLTLHFDYKFNKILLSGRQTALDSLVG